MNPGARSALGQVVQKQVVQNRRVEMAIPAKRLQVGRWRSISAHEQAAIAQAV
jgi:hypothetical protein